MLVSMVIVVDTPTVSTPSVSDDSDEKDDSILQCVRECTLDTCHAPDSIDYLTRKVATVYVEIFIRD